MLRKRRLATLMMLALLAAAAMAAMGVGRNAALAQVTCPAALPPAGNFTSAGTTQGQFKTNLSNLLAYLACLFGTDGTAATAKSTLGLATVATTGSYNDLSNKPSGTCTKLSVGGCIPAD